LIQRLGRFEIVRSLKTRSRHEARRRSRRLWIETERIFAVLHEDHTITPHQANAIIAELKADGEWATQVKFARDGYHFHHHGDAPDDADALVWETEAADYYKAAAERDTAKVAHEIDHYSRKIGVKLMPGSVEEKIVGRAISLELARQCENEASISRAASAGSQFGTGKPSVPAGAIEQSYPLYEHYLSSSSLTSMNLELVEGLMESGECVMGVESPFAANQVPFKSGVPAPVASDLVSVAVSRTVADSSMNNAALLAEPAEMRRLLEEVQKTLAITNQYISSERGSGAIVEPSKQTSAGKKIEPVDGLIEAMAKRLKAKKKKGNLWSKKTEKQAAQTFALLDKFLKEERAVEGLGAAKQADLAAFVNFLQDEIYKHYGKSPKDNARTIAELRIIALSKPAELRGLESGTLNRHLTFTDELFEFSETQGVELDPKLKITKLRLVQNKETRDRDERLKLNLSRVDTLFRQAAFANCAAWDRLSEPGADDQALIFHGAHYYVPMLMFYQGGRREEYCGLTVDDVVEDNGPIPYLRIEKNEFRRIKNSQSARNNPLHPEVIRLNFLKYVAVIRSLGYKLLFPDLFSPTTQSLLGDRFYKVFKPILLTAGIIEKGLGSHALRHAFGAVLKKLRLTVEDRAEALGHRGKSETSERYCEPHEIKVLYEIICMVPVVTGHLIAHPISLLPWVAKKEAPPFSHPTRAKKVVAA
jgi:integrase